MQYKRLNKCKGEIDFISYWTRLLTSKGVQPDGNFKTQGNTSILYSIVYLCFLRF
jgi:hypothetical protein